MRAFHDGLREIYCAFVAVTTATEEGMATPSTGVLSGGITGGGLLFTGGGEASLLAPQPEIASNATTEDAIRKFRMDENPPETEVRDHGKQA
jgi:hypothetical protein